jgi:hypothetical protein
LLSTITETNDTTWNKLYNIGGISALICSVMYVITLAVYIPANQAGPPPSSVLEWFALFQDHPLTGSFFLGLADIIIMIFWAPMSLALYTCLKQANKSWSLIAISFVFVGIAVYLGTNTAFSMLSLSQKYALATTEADKSSLLAAGQTLIAISEGTGGQYLGMPLAWLGGLILSAIMLRGKDFNRTTAWVGIIGLGLLIASIPFAGYTTAGPTTAAVGAITAVTYIGGGLLSLAWYILVGMRLIKLGRMNGLL